MSVVVYMVNETNIIRFGNRVEHMDTYINTDLTWTTYKTNGSKHGSNILLKAEIVATANNMEIHCMQIYDTNNRNTTKTNGELKCAKRVGSHVRLFEQVVLLLLQTRW